MPFSNLKKILYFLKKFLLIKFLSEDGTGANNFKKIKI